MNKVLLSGRLAQDVTLRENAQGKKYAYITLAVPSERSKETSWISILCNEKGAELLAEHASKGSLIEVDAFLKTHTTGEGKDKRTVTTVIMETFRFVGAKPKSDEDSPEEDAPKQKSQPKSDKKSDAKSEAKTKQETKKTKAQEPQDEEGVYDCDEGDKLPF